MTPLARCIAFSVLFTLVQWTLLTSFATPARASFADDIGVWEEQTSRYFPSSTADHASLAHRGSIIGLTDWDGSLNPGLLVLASHSADASGDHQQSNAPQKASTVVEYYSNTATDKGNTAFSKRWTTQPLPTDSEGGSVTVVGAITADLRRSGQLDLLLQGSNGLLYLAKRATDDMGAPQMPLPLIVSAAVNRSAAAGTAGPPAFSTRLRFVASPLVSLALLASDYPSIVYVNEDGALVELRWMGRDPQRRQDATVNESLDYRYEAYEIVSSTPATSLERAKGLSQRADGSPLGIQRGLKEVVTSSLAMADIDGDCVAELLYAVRDVGAKTLSLYAYQPHGLGSEAERRHGRTHLRLFEFAEKDGERLGSLTVADVDGDGAVDFVFPWRSSETTHGRGSDASTGYTGVMVFYSCPFSSSGCSAAANLTECRYNNAGDALVVLSERYCGPEQRQETDDPDTPAVYLSMPDSPVLPLIVRAGDYNRDGRVDLVVPSRRGPLLLTATGSRGSNHKARHVGDAADPPFRCAYLDKNLATAGTGAGVVRYKAAVPFMASLSETVGRLDVVLTSHTAVEGSAVYINRALPDRHYYVLVSALNGARSKTAERKGGGFGLAEPGATHHLVWEDVHMHTNWRRVTQLSQYVGFALQPPRLLIGLGETFSYVRGYSVGISASTASSAARTHQWPSYLVPNSQVFAMLHPIEEPEKWRLQLYLPTSRYRLLIGIALLVWLIVLGVPIVLLRWGEMRADYNEWKRR